jgi:hypothetical protein
VEIESEPQDVEITSVTPSIHDSFLVLDAEMRKCLKNTNAQSDSNVPISSEKDKNISELDDELRKCLSKDAANNSGIETNVIDVESELLKRLPKNVDLDKEAQVDTRISAEEEDELLNPINSEEQVNEEPVINEVSWPNDDSLELEEDQLFTEQEGKINFD